MFFLQIMKMDTNGQNIVTIISDQNGISVPKALAVFENRLYYLDPAYEKLERVFITGALNPKQLVTGPDLKTFTIFRKRPGLFKK